MIAMLPLAFSVSLVLCEMDKKYMLKYVGQEFRTNQGYTAKVVDGGSKGGYCTIKIEDYEFEVAICSLKRGTVKYPYNKSVYGVGCFGIGKHKAKYKGKRTKAYAVWQNMLGRCYSEKLLLKNPTYKDVTVSEDWHNYQAFAEWFTQNYIEGFALDKDLLSGDIKMYSKHTCIFIPEGLNSFIAFASFSSNNTSGNIGVSWDKQNKKWYASISVNGKLKYLGNFKNKQEAAEVYAKAREEQANIWKERMKGVVPQQAIDNIC